MSIIKAQSLREKTDQELLDQMRLEKKRIFDATMKGATGEAIKPHEKREGRRLVARIQTILRERELRRELDKQVGELTPKAQGASAGYAKLAQAQPRPHLARVRVRGAGELPASDRAALKLAEARRVRAAINREDMGEKR